MSREIREAAKQWLEQELRGAEAELRYHELSGLMPGFIGPYKRRVEILQALLTLV